MVSYQSSPGTMASVVVRSMIDPGPPVTESECRTTRPIPDRSIPAASASVCASAAAVKATKWSRFRASFAVVPAPASPKRITRSAMWPNGSRTRASASSSPPTMIASRPSAAPMNPPDTGASSRWSPRSRAAAASSCAVATSMVEWMLITPPGAMESNSSVVTSRTWASLSTMTDTPVQRRPTSPVVVAASAPAATRVATTSSRRSRTISPPSRVASRVAIGAPMLPSPMNP